MFYSLNSALFLTSFVLTAFGTRLRDITNKIYIGTELSPYTLPNDPAYAQIAAQEFNSIAVCVLWNSMSPTRGHTNYTVPDSLVTFAEKNNMSVRAPALVWASSSGIPKWLKSLEKNKHEFRHEISKHITEVVTHYKGRIFAWDVLNELFKGTEGQYNKHSIFHRVLGTEYIAEALHTAHKADPNAKLYINDVYTEGICNKSDALYALVKHLKAHGVPIHGVGFQSHLVVGTVPEDLTENLQRFADLDLDVAITELDIRIPMPANDSAVEQQTKDYAKFYSACLSVDRCVGVTVWGYTDKYSWVPEHFHGYGDGCLWDESLKPKAVVNAIKEVLISN